MRKVSIISGGLHTLMHMSHHVILSTYTLPSVAKHVSIVHLFLSNLHSNLNSNLQLYLSCYYNIVLLKWWEMLLGVVEDLSIGYIFS